MKQLCAPRSIPVSPEEEDYWRDREAEAAQADTLHVSPKSYPFIAEKTATAPSRRLGDFTPPRNFHVAAL